MISQDLILEGYNWHIKAFYNFTCDYTSDVVNALYRANLSSRLISKITPHLLSCKPNTGLTCSNTNENESVLVISIATSPKEFLNTLSHENQHLVGHIASKLGLLHGSEELGYLTGELFSKQYYYIKEFII